MRELYCGSVLSRILYSERGDCERRKRKLQRMCCRLYPFILLDNKKEGPSNFSGERNPHWVNHVYLSLLYCVSSMFYFRICFMLLLRDPVFLTS
jgi:hypothetical protein